MLRQALTAVTSAIVLTGTLQTSPATADPDPKPTAGVGACALLDMCINAGVGASPGGSGKSGGHTGGSRKSGGKKGAPAGAGPCIVVKMDPQPPASSSVWDGHAPGKGAIYTRMCPVAAAGAGAAGGLLGAPQTFWAPAAPVATVDPAQLAQEALDKMTLRGPDIGITPKPGGKGVVGMPVWMWTTKSAETYGPNRASASAGGITVTATARVKRIVWSMGDGTSVTCTTAGTPYKRSYGKKDSPDCGHHYSTPSSLEPGGRFHVTATSTWQVDWEVDGGGESGELSATRASDVDITVAEVQILN
ncbi:ATP/GTP-binding protein [Streptomyces sp. NPDC053474]|uniref:ATP/GTP-binding protein n=1 Tax=Streptomyces sp. NPDC053474 TaxID=3365704 RepID=UPI0037D0844D